MDTRRRGATLDKAPARTGYRLPWPSRGISYTADEIQKVVEVMSAPCSEALTQGPHQEEFEQAFSRYHGGLPAFATSSGAAALELAALLIRLQPGDEVIIPAHTYVASALPFARWGARIVWADIDPGTRVVTEETVAACLSGRTRAVVVVHLYGLNAPMDGLVSLARDQGIVIVEDCAQSLGASYRGGRSGTHGDIATYSFHAQKNITTLGEGGMITTRSPDFAEWIPGLRHNGHRPYPEDRARYWSPAMSNVDFDLENVWPYNFSIGEVQCALGTLLMSRLDDINARRYRYARRIIESLAESCPELEFQYIPTGSTHSYHLLCAKYDTVGSATRDDLIRILNTEFSIQPVVQYYPLYRYPLFVRAGMGDAHCPRTDEFFDNMLSFPFSETYSDEDIAFLTSSIQSAVESLR